MTGGRDVWHLAAAAGTVTLGAMQIVVRLLVVIVAMLLLPVAVGAARGVAANRSLYAPLAGAAAGATVPADAAARVHDPDKPTAVVVVGAKGAEVSDVLAPFEVLATTDAFNVYTAAPERRPLPLTRGLHPHPRPHLRRT